MDPASAGRPRYDGKPRDSTGKGEGLRGLHQAKSVVRYSASQQLLARTGSVEHIEILKYVHFYESRELTCAQFVNLLEQRSQF